MTLTLAASLLLAGCSGDSKPQASSSSNIGSSPTTTAPPTTTASPTSKAGQATDPNIPAAARAHTPAGAEAFVKYYIERWNLAWTGPRAGILSPLCQASSKSCAANEETATRLKKTGHRYDGNPVTIKFIGVLDATEPNKYHVLANLVQERRSEIDTAGRIFLTDKREDFRVNVELIFTGNTWSIATMKTIK
jgi:hypothetical protein